MRTRLIIFVPLEMVRAKQSEKNTGQYHSDCTTHRRRVTSEQHRYTTKLTLCQTHSISAHRLFFSDLSEMITDFFFLYLCELSIILR